MLAIIRAEAYLLWPICCGIMRGVLLCSGQPSSATSFGPLKTHRSVVALVL